MYRAILSYFSLCLLLAALFMLLGQWSGSGLGYLYLTWLGWQIQSNLLLILLLFFIVGAVFILAWYFIEKLIRRYVYRFQLPKTFKSLHPYERLWLVGLLHVEGTEQVQFFRTYKNSAFLYPLIHAKLLLGQGQLEDALLWLKKSKVRLFELNELIYIEIYLAQQRNEDAFQRLQFLSVQPISLWLKPLAQSYQDELLDKWAVLASRMPWRLYPLEVVFQFNSAQRLDWLKALAVHAKAQTDDEQTQFADWYHSCQLQRTEWTFEEQVALLKVIQQIERLDEDSILWASELLKVQFAQDVLYIWLAKVLKGTPNLAEVAEKVLNWQQCYPAQSSLCFALWQIYQRQGKYSEAEALLACYPDNVYMAYLRVKQHLPPDDEALQQDIARLLHYSEQDFDLEL